MFKSKVEKKFLEIIKREISNYNDFLRKESASREEAENKDLSVKIKFRVLTTTLCNFTEIFNYDFDIKYSVGGVIRSVEITSDKNIIHHITV